MGMFDFFKKTDPLEIWNTPQLPRKESPNPQPAETLSTESMKPEPITVQEIALTPVKLILPLEIVRKAELKQADPGRALYWRKFKSLDELVAELLRQWVEGKKDAREPTEH
jgi:hypothetical protein